MEAIMADEVTELEEVEAKLLLWVAKHDEVKALNYKLEDEVKALRDIISMQEFIKNANLDNDLMKQNLNRGQHEK